MSSLFSFEDPTIEARANRWVAISRSTAFQRLETGGNTHFFVNTIQRIGRLDCNLIREDKRIDTLSSSEEKYSQDNVVREYDHETLGVLWTIGAFGLVYSINRMMLKNNVRFPAANTRAASLSQKLRRLRRALGNGNPQDAVYLHPYYAMRFKGSSCWGVNARVYISRIDLSDELLEFLASIAAHRDRKS